MEKKLIHVLFMDDEIGKQDVAIVQDAIDALEKEGYSVTACKDMRHALDEFYKSPLKSIFILDIDMNDPEARGSDIASRYRSLDNWSKVIMFSARGDVEDWFEVANRHVYGYVDKNSKKPVKQLLELVEQAVTAPAERIALPDPRLPGGVVLLADDLDCEGFPLEKQEEAVRRAGFSPRACPLDEIKKQLPAENCAAVVLCAEAFSSRPSKFKLVRDLSSLQPTPHIIIATVGTRENRGFILDCINAHPFRLLDLNKESFESRLGEAVACAARWYGGNEVFKAREEDINALTSGMKPVFTESFESDFADEMYEVDGGEDGYGGQ